TCAWCAEQEILPYLWPPRRNPAARRSEDLGLAEAVLGRELFGGALLPHGHEDLEVAGAFGLGPVHGQVGVVEQSLRSFVASLPAGDSDTGRNVYGVVFHAAPGLRFLYGKRVPQLLEDPFRHSGRVPSLIEAVEQHGELVPPS